MLGYTAHINHMKQSYNTIDLSKYELRLLNIVQNSIEFKGDWSSFTDAAKIYEVLDSDIFYEEYAKALTDIFNKEFKDEAAGASNIDDIFDAKKIALSGGWSKLNNSSMKAILNQLDKSIIEIKKLMKMAFPSYKDAKEFQKVINSKGRADFLKNLETFFSVTKLDTVNQDIVQEFAGAAKSLNNAYKDFIKNGASGKKKFLDNIGGNFKTIAGSAIWERIPMIARAQAYEKVFDERIFGDSEKAFIKSGGKLKAVARPTQTGSEKTSDRKSIVSDSIVNIDIYSGDNIVLTITVGDSSKFSQYNWYSINETESQKKISKSLGTWLNQLGVRQYWVEREGVFLGQGNDNTAPPAEWRSQDVSNWNNTRAGIALLGMYDILAVRAGGNPAFSFSLNKKTVTTYRFIETYAREIAKKQTTGKIAGIPEFATQWKSYVKDVYSMTNDDSRQTARNTALRTLMETKVHISLNAFKGF